MWGNWRTVIFGSLVVAGLYGINGATFWLLLRPADPIEITIQVMDRGEKLCTVELPPVVAPPLLGE